MERDATTLHEIDKTARRCNKKIAAALDLAELVTSVRRAWLRKRKPCCKAEVIS